MEDNDNELEGNGPTDEEPLESESDDENDAILHEKKDADSPRDNI
jgi:hypothetical protein